MRYWLVILLIVYGGSLFAQFSEDEQRQIDSLNAIINDGASHDTTIALTYLEIAEYYYLKNTDTAMFFCKKSNDISVDANFKKGKADSYDWLGYLSEKKGQSEVALEYYHRSFLIDEELGNKMGMHPH